MTPRTSKGFTLIELLITIAIISFLAAAVLVAVDPVKRIQDSRDSRRSAEAEAILNAVLNEQVDTVGYFPGDTTASTGAPIIESSTRAQVIVNSNAGITCNGGGAAAPTCPQLPAGFSLDLTGANVNCVAKLDVAVQAPGALTAGAPTAGGSVTAGTHSYEVTFVTPAGETNLGAVSATQTTAGGNLTIPLTAIPTAPAASKTSARKIYRTAAGGTTYLLLTTINDNTTTTFNDTIADGSLGAAGPTSNTTGLAPKYIASLPVDPGTSTTVAGTALGASNTGYYIIRSPTSHRVTVGACYGENNTSISVTR